MVPYCAELSEAAERLQSVNTLVRRPDGTLYGDNTDLFGFLYMVRRSGIDPAGKKALVLGSGGASVTVKAALEQLGADVTVISRSGPDDYDHLDRHADAQIIANTTPVGMYPHNGAAAVDLRRFSRCEGVLDIVYNPARTALLLQAEELEIPHAGGLSMLVAQAKRSSEQFTGTVIGDEALGRVERTVNHRLRNIILIGMPGSGKSAVAAALGKALDREVVEADELISQRAGMSIPEIFARGGNIPETGNRGSGGTGQALRHHPLHRRRLRHPAGKLPAAASKRHHFPPNPRPCQAANGGPSHFPNHRPRSALRPRGAAVPPLCRRDGVQ